MDVSLVTLILFAALFTLVFLGVPLTFALGSTALVLGVALWGLSSLNLVANQISGAIFNYTLASVPFFLFMANMLKQSGIADDLYEAMYKWMGGLRGGLGIGTVLVCALIAAMTGVSAVGVIAMGTLALPAMLNRKYDKNIALGSILAGGALGQLIPPSVLGLVYSGLAGVSVGQIFLTGVVPGLMLTLLYVLYIGVRSYVQPALCPALPEEERRSITWGQKLASLTGVVPAIALIVIVLGSLFAGIASPTESAAVGAAGSILIAALHRRMNWPVLKQACVDTLTATTMVMWIALSSLLFVAVYLGIGGNAFVKSMLFGLDMGPWAVFAIMMAIVFLLGMIMDPVGILFLCVPIFLPIVKELGFDPLWFGAMLVINLETSYLTPPFGYNLFYLKSVAPRGVTMHDMYRAVPPFVAMQLLALVICALVPAMVLWLPAWSLGAR